MQNRVDEDEDDWENSEVKIISRLNWKEEEEEEEEKGEEDETRNYKQSEKDRLKALQQKLVEDADKELTEDLFNGVGSKLANILIKRPHNPVSVYMTLKTKNDYISFAEECARKVNSGTSLQLYEFYKTLFSNLSGNISSEHTRLIIKHLEGTISNKNIPQKIVPTKKEIQKQNARHAEIFGEAEEEEDNYDHYVLNYNL